MRQKYGYFAISSLQNSENNVNCNDVIASFVGNRSSKNLKKNRRETQKNPSRISKKPLEKFF